jgi:hypothetical protein
MQEWLNQLTKLATEGIIIPVRLVPEIDPELIRTIQYLSEQRKEEPIETKVDEIAIGKPINEDYTPSQEINEVTTIEKPKVLEYTVNGNSDWIEVNNKLFYKTDGPKLLLKYSGSLVCLNLEQIEKYNKMGLADQQTLLTDICGNTQNKKTAVRQFAEHYKDGKIKHDIPETPNNEQEVKKLDTRFLTASRPGSVLKVRS